MLGGGNNPRPVAGMMCIGGRYMITSNLRVSKGIANSAWVQLVDVILTDDAVVRWDPDLQAHCVDSCQVRGVVVAVPKREKEQLCAGLPLGQFFVPYTDYNFVFRWRKTEKDGKKLQARGPCLVMAHAVTGHKVQGATLKQAVVSSFDAINGRKVALDAGWLYVALSRVCKLSSLLLGTRVTPGMFKRRPDMELEFARLDLLDIRTVIKVHGETSELRARADAAHVRLQGLQQELENLQRVAIQKRAAKPVRKRREASESKQISKKPRLMKAKNGSRKRSATSTSSSARAAKHPRHSKD